MPINPMTGQLYSYATGGPPIGLSALDARPDYLKNLDNVLFGGQAFLSSVKYRSHRTLINKGEYTSRGMRTLGMANWMEKSYGASAQNPSSFGNIFREQFRDAATKFNPFAWGRAPSMRSMDPETSRAEYAVTNWALKKSRLINTSPFQEGGWAHSLIDEQGNLKHALDPNFASRIGAASTWDKMAKNANKTGEERLLSAEQKSTVESYLEHANPDLLSRLGPAWLEKATLSDAGTVTRMAMSKTITGRAGGYIQSKINPGSIPDDSPMLRDASGELTAAGRGYLSGEAGNDLFNYGRATGGVADLAGQSTEELAAKGLGKEAAEKFAMTSATKLATRFGLEAAGVFAGNVIPIAGQIMDVAFLAYIAYEGAKIGSKITSAAARGAIKSVASPIESFAGNIRKPQFGMGYHDTLAASTSRARGVRAIQNSRLNARSVLGSEASSVYQHFGS